MDRRGVATPRSHAILTVRPRTTASASCFTLSFGHLKAPMPSNSSTLRWLGSLAAEFGRSRPQRPATPRNRLQADLRRA